MPMFNVRGQEIYAEVRGSPKHQVALLIHGWSSSWYALSPLLDMVSQRFYCVAVDLPGYGLSPRLPQRTTIPQYADLLAELITQLSDGPAVLIGHSMGGMTSVTLALRYPVLVERMILLSPTITGKLSTYINVVVSPITLMERFGLGNLIVSSVERAFVGISDRIMRPASFAERTGITMEDYRRLRDDARRPWQAKVRAECYFAMRENDLSGQLSAVEPPALVIWGAEDNTVPLRDSGVVADEWPEADLRILPKAGHWPQFERPDATRRLVAAYLGLPLLSDKLRVQKGDKALAKTRDIARFLAHSNIGAGMNEAQRFRLASQAVMRHYRPDEMIVAADTVGDELYIIYEGAVAVWSAEESEDGVKEKRHVTDLWPGQMTGELSMFDEGPRSADLLAGEDGATLLAFSRERIRALCEDDAVLGTKLLWNLATAMSGRVRFILWQLHHAQQQLEEEKQAFAEHQRQIHPGE